MMAYIMFIQKMDSADFVSNYSQKCKNFAVN